MHRHGTAGHAAHRGLTEVLQVPLGDLEALQLQHLLAVQHPLQPALPPYEALSPAPVGPEPRGGCEAGHLAREAHGGPVGVLAHGDEADLLLVAPSPEPMDLAQVRFPVGAEPPEALDLA